MPNETALQLGFLTEEEVVGVAIAEALKKTNLIPNYLQLGDIEYVVVEEVEFKNDKYHRRLSIRLSVLLK